MSRVSDLSVPVAALTRAAVLVMLLATGAVLPTGATEAGPPPQQTPVAASGNCVLYVNGDPDGRSGYDNGLVPAYGGRRTLLDDFVVPFGETWVLEEMHHLHTWDTLPPGAGTGMEIMLRSDAGGTPGPVLVTLEVTDYMEMATGRVFFGRDEAESWTTFDAVMLAGGRYWFEAAVVGPEDDLWLTAPVQHEECWVNYEDVNGLESGSDRFGIPSDLSWCLSGDVILDPTGACCLPDASCLDDVPAGACRDGLLGIFFIGQTCDDVTCTPYGACCLLDGTCMSFVSESDCLASDGDFRDGHHCSLVTCAIRGACCLDDGTCEEISLAECVAASGDYRGDSVRCEDTQCPPAGACCLPNGTCIPILEVLCAEFDGDYQGNGVGCGITKCPIGACCRADGTCDVRTEGSCDRDGAIWRGEGTDCADFDGNGIPDTCEQISECRSDTNEDGIVDFLDIVTLLSDWGPCEADGATDEATDAAPRVLLAASGACSLYDNGAPDGVNGYSNAALDVFGFRRSLLDDFIVRTGESWVIEEIHHTHVWGTPMGGAQGTGMEISLWDDDGGRPGSRQFDFTVTDYMEMHTGRIMFDREEAESWTSFEPVILGPGHYWFDATIVGPENNFWLTAPQQNEECWVRYEDLCGFCSGTGQFGLASDISWCFSGQIVPDASGACCLADGSCMEDVAQSICQFELFGIFHAHLTCAEVTCTPFGACCLFGGTCVDRLTETNCAAQEGEYTDGARCADVECVARGACCFGDESCLEVTEPECVVAGGDYKGDGNRCEGEVCPPAGACCLAGGACVILTEFECTAANGDYVGDFVGCGITECPTGACCMADGTCAVQTEGSCDRAGGIWRGSDTDCADFNGNGIPDACEDIGSCRSDSNGDGVVDFLDLVTMLSDWGPCEG